MNFHIDLGFILFLISSSILSIPTYKYLKEKTEIKNKERQIQGLRAASNILRETTQHVLSANYALEDIIKLSSIQDLENFNKSLEGLESSTSELRKGFNAKLNKAYEGTGLKANSQQNQQQNNRPQGNSNQQLEDIARGNGLTLDQLKSKLREKGISEEKFLQSDKTQRKEMLA